MTEGLTEPGANWVPFPRAPFYFLRGYTETPSALDAALRSILERRGGNDCLTLEVTPDRDAHISGRGFRLSLYSTAGEFWLESTDNEDFPSVFVHGAPDELAERAKHENVPAALVPGLEWHLALAQSLSETMVARLERSLRTGVARVMARKGSPLSPFEYVPIDQLLCFSIDPIATNSGAPWFLPPFTDEEMGDAALRCSATGPGGERLFALHVAPCATVNKQPTAEEACTQWLIDLERQFPEFPPKPIRLLKAEALQRFPGLSSQGFLRAKADLRRARPATMWGRRGRHPARERR